MSKMTDRKSLIIFFMFIFITVSNLGIAKVKAETVSNSSETIKCTSYLALGDSISYGMSAETGKGYVDLFYNHLGTISNYGKVELKNLSVCGDKSSDLLAKLQTNEYQDAVKNAKIITISIGGNNLLSPIITAFCRAFDVNPNDPNCISELSSAMASNPNKDTILKGLATSSTLIEDLSSGIAQFKDDFPRIIQIIKTLSPKAEVYVLTLYNPFNVNDSLYSAVNPIINLLNATIKAQTTNYIAATDVYRKFKTTSGSVNFSFDNMLFDFHPTTVGHAAIYQSILDVETKNSQIVASNKRWTVNFTGYIGYDDLTKNEIVVTDNKGQKVNITLELGQDGKSIIVYPPAAGYTLGESYTLAVGKGVHNKNGKQMEQGKILYFTIK